MKNKGYSLVEVIITIAIMTIVLGCILKLVVSGTKMYAKTSVNVDVQTEAQLLESQLNNLIVDAECGVYAQTRGEGGASIVDTSGFTSDGYIKVFNYSVVYYIAWDESSQKVFYLEKEVVDGAVAELTEAEKTITNWNLMGEGVSSFIPDTSHVTESQRLVTVKLEVTKGQGRYSTVQNICLRNNVLESNDLANIYDGDAVDGEVTVTDVAISPQVVFANRGSSTVFSAVVSSRGQVAPSQEVVWSISGATSADTRIGGDGTLSIGWDETASVINITATAKNSIVYARACAVVPTVTGVSVSVNNDTPAAGTSALFSANVTGSNLDDTAKKVHWTIDTTGLSGVTISQNGVLSIGKNVAAGTEIIVRATAQATTGMETPVSGTCRITVSSKDVSGFSIVADSTTLNRNGTLYLTANLDGSNLTGKDKNIVWSIADDAGLGSKVSISQNGALTASGDINYAKSYQIIVKAETDSATLGRKYEATLAITIQKVTISFSSDAAIAVKGGTVRFPYTLTGLENVGTDIAVSSNPSVSNMSGTFMYCTATDLVVTIGSNVNKSNLTVTATVKGSSSVQGSVVVYIEDGGNVEGSALYIPVPSDKFGVVSNDMFQRVEGTNNSNTVERSIADKTVTYWISYENNDTYTYHMRMDQVIYDYDPDAGLWRKSS